MNRIQFQHALSMPVFLKDYGTEPQGDQALEAVGWPTEFCCPNHGNSGHYVLPGGVRRVFQCNVCRHQS